MAKKRKPLPEPTGVNPKRLAKQGEGKRFTRWMFEQALVANKGLVDQAAIALGCSITTFRRALKRWPDLRHLRDDQQVQLANLAVANLALALDHPRDPKTGKMLVKPKDVQGWAVGHALRYFGHRIGVVPVQRHEVSGADGNPIKTEHEVRLTLSPEQVRKLSYAQIERLLYGDARSGVEEVRSKDGEGPAPASGGDPQDDPPRSSH